MRTAWPEFFEENLAVLGCDAALSGIGCKTQSLRDCMAPSALCAAAKISLRQHFFRG